MSSVQQGKFELMRHVLITRDHSYLACHHTHFGYFQKGVPLHNCYPKNNCENDIQKIYQKKPFMVIQETHTFVFYYAIFQKNARKPQLKGATF